MSSKKSLVEVKDLVVVCLAATLWPLNHPRLWRSHRRDVTTTFTVHQTRPSPEFSVCSSARGCMSASVNRREKGCTDCGVLIRGLELSVKLPSRERLQKCSRNLVLSLCYTRPRSSLENDRLYPTIRVNVVNNPFRQRAFQNICSAWLLKKN